MSGEHVPLTLWIEGLVALVIMTAFVVHSHFAFKTAHVEHHPARVRIGAAIQGLVLGLLVGFVLVPLRMRFMDGGADMESGSSALAFMPAVLLLILIRRGVLLKAPVLSTYLRAYRRAGLLKQRDDVTKALTKLDIAEGRAVPA